MKKGISFPNSQLKKKQIILDKDFSLKKDIRIFLDTSLEEKSNSFRLILWFGEEDDGSGERVEFIDLLSNERLKLLNSQKFKIFIPTFLQAADKTRFLEETVEKAIFPDLILEIHPSRDLHNSDMITLELVIEKMRYFSSLDLLFTQFSEILTKNPV